MRHFGNIATLDHGPARAPVITASAPSLLVRLAPLILLSVVLAIWLATTLLVGLGLGTTIEYHRHNPSPIAHAVAARPD